MKDNKVYVMTVEIRQKKAEIGRSTGLKCHEFLPLSSRKVSAFSTDHILSVTKNLYPSSKKCQRKNQMGNLNVNVIRRNINIQGVIVSTLTLKIVKIGSYQRFLNYEKSQLIKTQFKKVHDIMTPRFKNVLIFYRNVQNWTATCWQVRSESNWMK